MMEKNRAEIFELLKNEHFVQWVQSPTKDSEHYWSKWVSNHPDRKRDVEIARAIIQSSKLQSDEKMPEEVYDHLLENIVNYGYNAKQKTRSIGARLWRPLSIAASISIIVFVSILSLRNRDESNMQVVATTMIEKEAPLGKKITTKLPDGTIVNLNSGTKITFPDQFGERVREVTLTGEAFFEVEHNPDKPFIVNMNGDKVRVLGTSFNIRSYPEDSLVCISVATGRVSYTIPSGEEVILLPNQMATYLPSEGRLTTGEVDSLQAFGWKDRIIYFKSATFDEITKELNRWYGIKIESKGDFNRVGTFTGEFRNETLFQVLKGLSFVYQFEFELDEDKATIRKI